MPFLTEVLFCFCWFCLQGRRFQQNTNSKRYTYPSLVADLFCGYSVYKITQTVLLCLCDLQVTLYTCAGVLWHVAHDALTPYHDVHGNEANIS